MSTKTTQHVKKIKPLLNFSRLSDTDLLKRLDGIHDRLTGNMNFPTPPVDMATFKSAIDSYNTLTTDALDGGKKVVSAKRKQRELVIKMAEDIGHYVGSKSNNDLAIFNTSGFDAAQNVKSPLQPLTQAGIQYVDRGPISGSVVIKPKTLKGAVSYEMHYATVPAAGTTPAVGAGTVPNPGPSVVPGLWTSIMLPTPKATTITNLAPGTTYQFHVRGLGKLGYSDWSDPVNFICG
jgi:hypothetical protein